MLWPRIHRYKSVRHTPMSWPWPDAIEAQAKGRRAAELEHAEQENSALDVLTELVRLKDGPRDEGYRAEKEHAWERARAVLAEHGLTKGEEPSTH